MGAIIESLLTSPETDLDLVARHSEVNSSRRCFSRRIHFSWEETGFQCVLPLRLIVVWRPGGMLADKLPLFRLNTTLQRIISAVS